MKRIIVGKIGQKIIFDRKSQGCQRSNTNGNVGTFKFLQMLFENNPKDQFYVVGQNDRFVQQWDNVVDASSLTQKQFSKAFPQIDEMIILAGLVEFEPKESNLFDIINFTSCKYKLVVDDPRCLESVEKCGLIKRVPNVIISQVGEEKYLYDNTFLLPSKHLFIERSVVYNNDNVNDVIKDKSMIIAANTSGDRYDRLKILRDLLKDIDNKDIEIYGRMDEKYQKAFKGLYKGEVEYSYLQDQFKRAKMSLLIPIRKGWLTSKYVECLMNNVYPIFYCEYGYDKLEVDDLTIVHNSKDLKEAMIELQNDELRMKRIAKWKKEMIAPYYDGAILSNQIINL